jgi:hypothetical protein
MNISEFEARHIKKEVENKILKKANVVAAGIGYKNDDPEQGLSIITSVVEKLPKKQVSRFQMIPKSVDGLQTDVIQTGEIKALFDPTQKYRPIPQGCSVGHKDITAGTLGAWVHADGYFDKRVMLSNNHVLANSNLCEIGDDILQPGPHDQGQEVVAKLLNYIPLHFKKSAISGCPWANTVAYVLNKISDWMGSGTKMYPYFETQTENNLVDAAIAEVDDNDYDSLVYPKYWDDSEIQGWAVGQLGDYVKKFGRTTGFTEDEIKQVDVSVTVSYGSQGYAKFTNQFMAGAMSAGGDSGSTVLNKDNKVVGLLFAGSETTTIFNPIKFVIDALDLKFAINNTF